MLVNSICFSKGNVCSHYFLSVPLHSVSFVFFAFFTSRPLRFKCRFFFSIHFIRFITSASVLVIAMNYWIDSDRLLFKYISVSLLLLLICIHFSIVLTINYFHSGNLMAIKLYLITNNIRDI